MMLEKVKTHNDKQVSFGSYKSFEEASKNPFNLKKYFIVTFFLNKSSIENDSFKKIIENLLDSGCVYFIFHGDQCEEAHDLTDLIIVDREAKLGYEPLTENTIMTTWHKDETMEDVLDFIFYSVIPAENFINSLKSYLIISLGDPQENNKIRKLIKA